MSFTTTGLFQLVPSSPSPNRSTGIL